MPAPDSAKLLPAVAAARGQELASNNPLLQIARARLYGGGASTERMMLPNYSSSGSEHDPSSVCLAAMVNEFMEDETSFGQCRRARHCDADGCRRMDSEDSKSSIGGEVSTLLEGLVQCASDTEAILLKEVMESVFSTIGEIGSNPGLKRIVMKQLRRAGHNAAICKSRWGHSCGIPAGDYEYIDILGETHSKHQRLIVDVEFRAQFEIARPTSGYLEVWQLLPAIFVGKSERLQQIIDIMSEAAKHSLKLQGLHLPPWRKSSYLKAKWFSPYKRTSSDHNHLYREPEEDHTGRDFQGIGLRGSGLDARCTNELELLYHEAGSRFLAKGANKGKGYLKQEITQGALRNANNFRNERDEITVLSTDWQPPIVAPRSVQQKPGKVTGLSSVLLQAGLAKHQYTASEEEETLARAA